MQRRLITFSSSNRSAFTLIELLVVIVILGILIAVALPTYLRQQSKAKDSNAKQQLTYAYRAIRSALPEFNDSYPSVASVVSAIQQSEPELTVASGGCNGATTDKQVEVDPILTTSSKLALYTKSSSGNWFRLSASPSGAQTFTQLASCQGPLTAGSMPMSGNEITDAVRAGASQGDGRSTDSSVGVWEGTTNLAPAGTDNSIYGYDSGANIFAATPAPDFSASGFYRIPRTNPANGLTTYEIYEHDLKRVSVTAGTTYTWSLLYRTDGNGYLRLHVWPTDQTPNNSTFDLNVQDLGNGLKRGSYTYTMVNSGLVRPIDYSPVWGNSTYFDVKWVQLEQKNFATPFVPQGTSRGFAAVTPASTLLSASQGWFAARVRAGWTTAQASVTSLFPTIAQFGLASGPRFQLIYRSPTSDWRMRASDGTTSNDAVISQTLNPGDVVTVIGYWVANSLIGVSVNGSAFSLSPEALSVSPSANFYIGTANGSNAFDGDILWFAAGKGTLTNSDAQTINSWGSNDPTTQDFPAAAQATIAWSADTATYVTGN